MIDDTLLCDLFRRGLIPGPDETEEAFLKRVEKATSLDHPEWREAAQKTVHSFGFNIDWVPMEYSNRKLAWWEGAATWLQEDHLPSIQLRNSFKKGSFLGYHRSDILAHEALHAARMCFKEPKFEEILAYSIAPEKWKRFFGPFFVRPWESVVLLVSFMIGIFIPWIPMGLLSLGLARLSWRQWIFRKCRRKFPLEIILCLTDQEIKSRSWKKDRSTVRLRLLSLLDN